MQGVFRTQPDAVILDVQMPRLSGYVAARLLKDDWQTAEIPVVLLTSLDAASDRYWGKQTGADRFLTKDFEAPELVERRSPRSSQAADAARGGRPPLRPDPVELGDDEVLARVSELLDRKLFEASVSSEVTQIAADVHGFEETVAAVLGVLGRIVDYDLAAVCMLDDRLTYLTVARESSQLQYTEFFGAIADAATQVTGEPVDGARPGAAGRRRQRLPRPGRRGPDGDLPVDAAAGRWPGRGLPGAVQRHQERVRRGVAEHPAARRGPAAVVISNARLAGSVHQA